MSMPRGPTFSAHVGLDWADAKHDFCLHPGGSVEREFDRFTHKLDQIDAWARGLKARFGGTIAVAPIIGRDSCRHAVSG